jgi:uncharacterized protein with PQ loop repeat
MDDLVDYAPIAAAAFAIPQFLPQLRRLRATDDTAGISWSWATLTSVNNAAWLAYLALSGYWTALVPACSATLLAGALAIMLTRRGQARARPTALISSWAALLIAASPWPAAPAENAAHGGLHPPGHPSLWTAYRTDHPDGRRTRNLAAHPG